jgi:hypothetical protein
MEPRLIKVVLKELGGNPYRKFNGAFSLMSIIPFLVFFYLLTGKLFSVDILASDIGIVLSISIFISLCGYWVGYKVIRRLLAKVITYGLELTQYNEQLKSAITETVFDSPQNSSDNSPQV